MSRYCQRNGAVTARVSTTTIFECCMTNKAICSHTLGGPSNGPLFFFLLSTQTQTQTQNSVAGSLLFENRFADFVIIKENVLTIAMHYAMHTPFVNF